jgi:hypothetical protein
MTNRSNITGALAILALLLCSGLALAGGKNETAATNWVVIINDPGACSGTPCSEEDIFGSWPENPTSATVCYLTGQSVQANKRATFAGRFGEGTNYGCLEIFAGPIMGLMDADAAEVHMILQEHGWSLKSGRGLEAQVAYFEAYCNPECNDTQVTIHTPGDADADGVSVSSVYRFGDFSMVDGATSTLIRGNGGFRLITHTRLEEDE